MRLGHRYTLAALMVLIMGVALALMVVAFPFLSRYDETLALGYVVFRGALQGTAYLGIVVSWLLFLPLSGLSQPDAAWQSWANVLLEGTKWGRH